MANTSEVLANAAQQYQNALATYNFKNAINAQLQQANVNAIQKSQNTFQQNSSNLAPATTPIPGQTVQQPTPVTPLPQLVNDLTDEQIRTLQQNQNTNIGSVPTPQTYQAPTNTNTIDFSQIYNAYQSQYGTNPSNTSSTGIKKSSIGTTIVTPTNTNLNTVEGQYQSEFAGTINTLISKILENVDTGFQYNPNEDSALKIASEYAASSAMEQMNARGILNSSSTAERVATVVSQLIPEYEKLAYTRWQDGIAMLSETAQLVMSYDNQQFQYWKDAKDREFETKKFEWEKKQKELENAWRRVDELGYVDNQSSAILGVAVGTLSKAAREAKEQREFELKKMREQMELEYKNNVAIAKFKADAEYKNQIAYLNAQTKAEKDVYNYKANLDYKLNKASAQDQAELNKQMAEYEYQLQQKYSTSSSSSTKNANSTTLSSGGQQFYNFMVNAMNTTSGVTNEATVHYITRAYNAGRISKTDVAIILQKLGLS